MLVEVSASVTFRLWLLSCKLGLDCRSHTAWTTGHAWRLGCTCVPARMSSIILWACASPSKLSVYRHGGLYGSIGWVLFCLFLWPHSITSLPPVSRLARPSCAILCFHRISSYVRVRRVVGLFCISHVSLKPLAEDCFY